jgi:hypothetical protein
MESTGRESGTCSMQWEKINTYKILTRILAGIKHLEDARLRYTF